MNLWGIVIATLVAGALGSLSDWLFMGILFHDHYNAHPEVWRESVRGGKAREAILWSAALGFLMSLCVVLLCGLTGMRHIGPCLAVAVLAYLAGPLPQLLVQALFVKIDSRITAAHAAGYFIRFALAAIAASIVAG